LHIEFLQVPPHYPNHNVGPYSFTLNHKEVPYHFCQRDAMLERYMLWLCLSVCHKPEFYKTVKRIEVVFGGLPKNRNPQSPRNPLKSDVG